MGGGDDRREEMRRGRGRGRGKYFWRLWIAGFLA